MVPSSRLMGKLVYRRFLQPLMLARRVGWWWVNPAARSKAWLTWARKLVPKDMGVSCGGRREDGALILSAGRRDAPDRNAGGHWVGPRYPRDSAAGRWANLAGPRLCGSRPETAASPT